MNKKERFLRLLENYALACLGANETCTTEEGIVKTVGAMDVLRAVSTAMDIKSKKIPYDPDKPHLIEDAVTSFFYWSYTGRSDIRKPYWLRDEAKV